ncbi:GNAT family N-acetyltransferase, partial [Micromonospora sp. NPDC049903]|uniref:GNAT family N-acetyltransferase n=1 Tax=Micromonospora sp. NPDC049903 TaxID=3364276 RepID=UPI0037ACE4AB
PPRAGPMAGAGRRPDRRRTPQWVTVDSLYDIEVKPTHRGAGYGRKLLAAGEDVVRRHGVSALELNVFGDNDRARRLYQSSGYRVVTQQMRKTLTGDAR